MPPKVGDRVEVQQDPDDQGWAGAWYTATITQIDKHRCTVEYDELITDDGDKDTDTVSLTRLRPIYANDDSRTKPLQERICGEPVDCWYDDGWWEGYVHITRDTELVVFFPSNGDLVTIPYDQSNKPEDQQKRLRTRRKWHNKDRIWNKMHMKSFDGAADERTAPRPSPPLSQLDTRVSKDIFEQKQRELEQQRAKKRAAQLSAFGSETTSDDGAAAAAGAASEAGPSQPAGPSGRQAPEKPNLKMKLKVGADQEGAGQQGSERGDAKVKEATWAADKEAKGDKAALLRKGSGAAAAAAAELDPLGEATAIGAEAVIPEAGKAAPATPNEGAAAGAWPKRPPAKPGRPTIAATGAAKAKKEAVAKAGAPAAKAGAGAPQGLQKKVVKKKDPAGKPKRGQEAENPHLVEAMKVIEAEGWKPLDPVKGASWSEEETEMLYSIEAKCVAYDNDTVVNVRKHLAMTLLPHRDIDSLRKFRSTHKDQLNDIWIAAQKEKAGAAADQAGPSRPTQQRQQQRQQQQQQQRQQRQADAAKAAARPAAKQPADPDTPGLDAHAKKGAGKAVKQPADPETPGLDAYAKRAAGRAAQARGEEEALPDTPRGAEKQKVTEIGGKKMLLGHRQASLEQRLSSRSLGIDAMPGAGPPATSAPMTSAGPSHAASPFQPAWRLPSDPRLRTNRGEGIVPMPQPAIAQSQQEPGWPRSDPAGDVQMVEDLPPHMLDEQLARRAKTSGRKRRSRSPEREVTPEEVRVLPPIKRLASGARPGSARPSNIICLDGIGQVWRSNKELEAALRPFVADFSRVEIAMEMVDGHPCHAGWAAVIFPSAQDAAEYLPTMQNLYLRTPSIPLPRPLLAHYPRKTEDDFDKHIGYGFVQGIYVAPHFAQPNSIEYQPALEWRRLQNATRACKCMHREQHAAKLAEVMRMYQKKAEGDQVSAEDQVPPPPPLKTPWLFVKGIGAPALADPQIIRSAFEQWGARDVKVPRDPVTGKTRGVALIRLQDPYQVELLKGDLDEMVYIMAGSPRPLQSHMLDMGLPRECWQAMHDSALFTVFKRDDRGNGPAAPAGAPLLVKIERPRSLEEWYAQRLRNLLERGTEERLDLQAVLNGQREALHLAHTRQYDGEVGKLVDANMINCTDIMKSLRTGKRKEFKELRNMPDRYKYLLQYGNGKVGMAPGALPGNAEQPKPVAAGRGMTMGVRGQTNHTRYNRGRHGRPYHSQQRSKR